MSLPPAETQLMRLANAFQLSRAVQVAARLDLGRLLADGARSVVDLARATGTDEGTLRRLLRFLAEIGVVREDGSGHFSSTPLSERLHLVDNIAQGEEAWAVWGALPEALRSGEPAFSRLHGAPFYEYAAAHPRQEAHWAEWNRLLGQTVFPHLVEGLGLSGTETVVDVGGGDGGLLAAVLARFPGSSGVLLDLPGALRGAGPVLERAGVGHRCRIVEGDAREGVPGGGDVYLLSRVLQNCDDAAATCILERCGAALGEEGRLLAVESLMPEPGDPRRRSLAGSDLNLFLLWGGGHRARDEMGSLFTAAGLVLVRVSETPVPGWHLLEAQRSFGPPDESRS